MTAWPGAIFGRRRISAMLPPVVLRLARSDWPRVPLRRHWLAIKIPDITEFRRYCRISRCPVLHPCCRYAAARAIWLRCGVRKTVVSYFHTEAVFYTDSGISLSHSTNWCEKCQSPPLELRMQRQFVSVKEKYEGFKTTWQTSFEQCEARSSSRLAFPGKDCYDCISCISREAAAEEARSDVTSHSYAMVPCV